MVNTYLGPHQDEIASAESRKQIQSSNSVIRIGVMPQDVHVTGSNIVLSSIQRIHIHILYIVFII